MRAAVVAVVRRGEVLMSRRSYSRARAAAIRRATVRPILSRAMSALTQPSAPPDGAPTAQSWRTLVLVALSTMCGMSLWFVGTALMPQLRERWGLGAAQAGWLTAVVQL